jgi:type IV pilus assembly protein PilA
LIVGILSAVALPNFLGTKNKAEAQALIGSMAGQAKLCGSNMIIGDKAALPTMAGVNVSGACSGGGTDVTIANTTAFSDATKIGGVNCGGDVHDGAAGTTCTLTVDGDTGSFSGAWS